MRKKLGGNEYLLRKILDYPLFYRVFENIVIKRNGRAEFVKRYISNVTGKRILDLGCGTADILACIENELCYVGIDNNSRYIAENREKYEKRSNVKFYHTDLNQYAAKCKKKYDLVLMMGVMHHISDDEVDKAMENIKKLLDAGGEFVSLDPCYTEHMNPIAWILCRLDRGKYVRTKAEWIELMSRHWKNIWHEERKDTLILPYSVIVFRNTGADINEKKEFI